MDAGSDTNSSDGSDRDRTEWKTVKARARPDQKKGLARGAGANGVQDPVPTRRWQVRKNATCGGHIGHQDRHALERKVFVSELASSTTDGLLKAAFKHCGRIEEARVVRTADGSSRGFGFVVFTDAGAAEMAARSDGVRVDGKLCFARIARPREEGAGPTRRAGDARSEVRDFITRHELTAGARTALANADPKVAQRVVRAIESCHQGWCEGLIHTELQKVASSHLNAEVEARVSRWVAGTGLSPEWQEKVESVLLVQRVDEIEHVLEIGASRWFQSELCTKNVPTTWLLAQVQKFRRQQILGDIRAFCQRFGFDQSTERELAELSAERARRLMQNWSPAQPGTQVQRQQEFLVLLRQAVKERRAFMDERDRKRVSAVASHARIIEEWSDEEDEEDGDRPPLHQSRAGHDEDFYAFDLGDWEGHGERPTPQKTKPSSSTEQFVIHSAAGSAIGASTTVHSQRRRQPKPTHFVMCVDTSGSMVTHDCQGASGSPTTRLNVVLETCNTFITESMMTAEDIYSFVTFNEESVLHFSCLRAFDAVSALEAVHPLAEKQTFYAMGIRGIEAAIKRDPRRLPAHVVFLSDGEPTDPSTYLRDLHVLRRRHPGDTLKIYTVGFGESAKVNAKEDDFVYLQQLASLGRGHFQRCGASLSSLKGAFTAVTSTISRTRTSGRRSTTERESATMPAPAATPGWAVSSAAAPGTAAAAAAASTGAVAGMPESIAEELGDSSGSSGGEGGGPAGGASRWGGAVLERPVSSVEFELPHAGAIFRDVHSPELWKTFKCAQTSFKFDGGTFKRTPDVLRVYLRRKPFMQGGMRLVYGMVLERGLQAPDAVEHMMCAKRLFQDLEKDGGFQAHAAFCKSTAVAQHYARQFRAATERASTRVQFGFLDCHLYSPVCTNEEGYHFCGEQWLKGHFVKLNSNAGFVNEVDYSEHSEIAQAFSHFTFDRSHGELLVVDLQGICGGDEGSPYFLLTDPQVHSRGAFGRFGAGDLGEQGISAFFQKHKCGRMCRMLQLRKEHNLRAPTHVLPMPGVQDCIRYMLGFDSKDFFQHLRQSCSISSLAMPREAYREWLDIRMWSTRRGGNRAEQMLRRRLEGFYEKARQVVPVPQEPRPRWDTARWCERLDAWRKESGAAIVAWPPDWQEAGSGVQELWVFSELVGGGWYNHQNRNFACQRIHEALEASQDEAPGVDAGASSGSGHGNGLAAEVPVPQEAWRQYQDRNGNKFWYREPDGYWFWETDSQWQRFLDKGSRRNWWWNTETGLWFFEPRGEDALPRDVQ